MQETTARAETGASPTPEPYPGPADDAQQQLPLGTAGEPPFDAAANEPRRALGARQPAASDLLQKGFQLFEYRIDQVLGQGGFGVAYAATDVNLNTRFVVKEYLPQELVYRDTAMRLCAREDRDQEFYQVGLDQFLAEARALATFRHPHIVRVARF